MCQYELWVYTRCRSSSPPVPPLPPSFTPQYLCLPPDQANVDFPTYSAASLAHTWPHTAYYRVTKCLLSPQCAPPSFSYLSPPPPPSPKAMKQIIPAVQAPSGSLQPPLAGPGSQESSQPTSPAPSAPSAPSATPQPERSDIAHLNTAQGLVPIHIRHSYCHTCYQILRETIDGDGELCFPIGSENWLTETGKSTGRCWKMDERAARGDVIVDLDYATGIDWGVEFEPAQVGVGKSGPTTTLEIATKLSTVLAQAYQETATQQIDSSTMLMRSERELRAQEAAREIAREREAMKERAAREALRNAMTKEVEKRKARIAAENVRKRRWKGWEAWGVPYVVPSSSRVARAGAS